MMDNSIIQNKYFIVDYTLKVPRKPFIQPLKHFQLMNDKAYQNKIKQDELNYLESIQEYMQSLEEFYLAQLQKYILNKEKYKVLKSIKEFDFGQMIENNCFWLQTNTNQESQNYILQFKHLNCHGKQKQVKLNSIRYQENKVRGSSLSLRIVKFNSKEQKEQFSLFHFFSQKTTQQKGFLTKTVAQIQKNKDFQSKKFASPEQTDSSSENDEIIQEDDIQSNERLMTPQFFNQYEILDEDIELYDQTTASLYSPIKKGDDQSNKKDSKIDKNQKLNAVAEKKNHKNNYKFKEDISNNNVQQNTYNKEVIMIDDDSDNDENKLHEIQQQNKNQQQIQFQIDQDRTIKMQIKPDAKSYQQKYQQNSNNLNISKKQIQEQQINQKQYSKIQEQQQNKQVIKEQILLTEQQNKYLKDQNQKNKITYQIKQSSFIIIND